MPGTPFPSVIDLGALGAAGFKILGDADDDLAGHAVACAGDFNGDGFGDIIVGAPGNDGEAGAAYLIFGKASGFGTVDLASLAAADGFKITGDLAVDYAGFSVASAGDLNGDGFDDIVVGARYNDAGAADGGAAYVIFGKASGFGAIDLAALAPADGFRIVGAADYDQAGFSVASAGDVDGDGYDDLLVGAVGYDGGATNRGAAYVIFGKQSGLGDIDLASLAPADGFVLRGGADYDAAGTSVSSAGDVNGDGIDDIIVGAPNVDDNAASSYGAAYVIFGRETGWADLDLASLDPADGFTIQGGSAYDFAGTSVASAGDVNGDGFADLLIGAPRYTEPGDYPGVAYVVFGKESGFSDIDLASLAPADGFRIRGAANYDLTGYSVASAGDVNGDGFADLIIGARENDGGGSNAGAAFVVFGKASGLSDIDLASLGSADGFKIQGEVFNDVAGWSVSSAGDVNDDGYDDMLVGARSNDGGDPNAGAAYLIFGHATDDQPQLFYQPESDDNPVNTTSGNAQTEPAITFLADGRYVVTWTSADGGLAGEEVRARIFDADGIEDVAEFVVNAVPAGDQDSSAVAALDPGGFVIVWRDGATTDIMAQRYAAAGTSVGAPILVNGSTLDTASDPSVAGRPGGGFVVSWTDASGVSTEVMARVFDSSGTALGVEFQVNMATNLAQEHSGVAVLSNGNFVVVWKDGSGEGHDTDGTGIRMRVFDSTGSALIGEVAVNSTIASTQEFPVITALSGGRFVVAWVDWSGTGTDTSGSAIRARVFQGDTPIGDDFVVNTNVLNGQSQPTIDAAPDGGFTIGWTDASGATTDIRAQRFDASGNRIGDEVLVNTIATGAQNEPALSIGADGTLVVAWTDASGVLDASGTGIAQRLFSESEPPTLDLNGADAGTGFASAHSEGGTGARVADDDVLVTAPDHQITGATITITDAIAGDQLVLSGDLPAGIAAGGTGTATIILSGPASASDYEEALRLILYTSASDNPTLAGVDLQRTIEITLTDGLNDSEAATTIVTVSGVNDAPTAAVADALAATEQVALSLKGSMSVADVDAGAGSLTATLSVGYGVLHLEAGTSGAGISNNDSAAVTITGTLAQINALLGSGGTSVVDFTANTDTPPATTTLTLSVNDGGNSGSGGAQTGNDSATIAITPVNDPPTLVATAHDPTYTEDGPAADLFGSVTASTVESGQTFTTMTLSVTSVTDGPAEILRIDGSDLALTNGSSVTTATNGLYVSVFLSGTTAELSFSNAALDAAQLQTLVDALSYRNASQNPTAGDRVVSIVSLFDSGSNDFPNNNGAGPNLSSTVTVAAVNDAPTIDNVDGDEATFTEGGPPVRLDAGGDAAVADADPGLFAARVVGTGFVFAVFIASVPDGSGRLFVVELGGVIRILDPETGITAATPFLDVSSEVRTQGEEGLLGFAAAPDFATSGDFYIFMTNAAGDNEVRRYHTMSGNPDQADAASMDVIAAIPHPAVFHNAGWIGFGPDGYLYVAVGDGAVNAADAQDPNSLNGKVLRIDVSQDHFVDPLRDYAIPLDNPFAAGGGLPEIWALGLRNPYRNSFDAETGNFYIGDVGGGMAEEVNLMRPTDGGANFGWPVREGTFTLNGPDSPDFTPPVLQFLHPPGPSAILGGYVYRGPVESLQGQYIFGDVYGPFASEGTLWSISASSLVPGSTAGIAQFTPRTAAFAPDEGVNGLITTFGVDEAQNLYFADLVHGRIVRIEPTAAANFAGGRLTVAIVQNKAAGEDRLQIDLSPATTVTLSNGMNINSEVRIGGVLIGVIAPGGTGIGAHDLIIDFTSGATPARIDTLLHSLTYLNTNTGAPSTAPRTISYTFEDGGGTANGGHDSVTLTSTVNITPVNDPPTLVATAHDPTYTEDGPAADLFGSVTASTVESGQTFTTMTLSVTSVTDGPAEILRIDGSDLALTNGSSVTTATNGLYVSVFLSGTTAELSFSNAALDAAQLQTLVDALSYRNASQNPTAGDRVVSILSLFDSGSNAFPNNNGAGPNLSSIVTVDPVNDAPTANDDILAASEDMPVTYAAADLTGNDTDAEPDTLAVASVSNATGGTAMRNGDGTVTFTPTPDFNGVAGFDYLVSDGHGGTDTGRATVNVAAVNDSPTVAIGGGLAATEQIPLDLKGTIALGDIDAGAGTIHVTLAVDYGVIDVDAGTSGADVSDSGTGAVTITGTLAEIQALLGSDATSIVSYTPDTDAPPASAELSVTVDDGGNSGTGGALTATDSETIAIGAVNDAPTVTIAGSDLVPQGGEVQVNTTTANDQSFAFVAALAGGGHVVTWRSLEQDGDFYGIYAQRYDAAGVAQGGEVRVNITTFDNQQSASVAALTGDGYVVTWMSLFQDGSVYGVYSRRYDGSGVALSGEILVNTTTASSQQNPASAGLADGGHIVVWTSLAQEGGGGGFGIYAQRYDAAGGAQGGEVHVNTTTANDQTAPWVAGLSGGGYVITWDSRNQDGDGFGIYAQRYDAAGVAQGGEVRINETIASDQTNSSVAALAGGGYIVVWQSLNQDGDNLGVYARRYDAGGVALSGEVQVSTTTADAQLDPWATALSDGSYVIAWSSDGQDGSASGIYVRHYDASGTPLTGEMQVNTTTESLQIRPVVAPIPGGGFIVAWNSRDQDGDQYGIFTRRYGDGLAATEQIPLDLKGTIAIGDVDAGAGPITVDLLVDFGVLDASAGTSGAIVGGAGTAALSITGTLAQVQAMLVSNGTSTITYTAGTDDPPAIANLTVTVNDNGHSGSGGDETATACETIHIAGVNDAPSGTSVTITMNEDAGHALTAANFGLVDVEGDGFAGVVLTSLPTAGVLVFDPDGGAGWMPGVLAFAGQFVTAAQIAAGRLVYYPGSNANGASFANFTFQVRDDGGTANGGQNTDQSPNTITFNVTPVNDAPVVDLNGAGNGTSVTLAYTENDPVTPIAPAAVAGDVDHPNYDQGRFQVMITNGINAEDVLSIINQGTGPGQIGYSNGMITYEGHPIGHLLPTLGYHIPFLDVDLEGANVSLAAVQALIRAVGYHNLSESPALTTRTLEFSLQEPSAPGALITIATATISLTTVEDEPVARDDAFATDEATPITGSVFADNGSGSDVDLDGPPLTVVAVSSGTVGSQFALPSGALLTLSANGTFSYNPNGVFNATPAPGSGAVNQPVVEIFSYTLSGGATADVTITINGVDSDDVLHGTAGVDSLFGGVGNDLLVGGASGDQLHGGDGDDTLLGEDGDDYLEGGAGRDGLIGGAGVDILAGGAKGDYLFGDDGGDTLLGGDGDDHMEGGAGQDGMLGGAGIDTLVGGLDGDWLFGGDDGDTLLGEAGDDYLQGGAGRDGLAGGAGIDFLLGGAEGDYLFGEDGSDTLLGEAGDDHLDGGAGSDGILGGEGSDFIAGGADHDYLFGEGGADTIVGDDGDDVLDGGDGDDGLAGGTGADRLNGGNGRDYGLGGIGDDFIVGGADNDVLLGEDGSDTLIGEAGDDRIEGGAGADVVLGGDANDYIDGGADGDLLFGEDGDDTILGGEGDDHIEAGAGQDGVLGGAGADFILGGADGDYLFGEDGADNLLGGDGDDYLDGGSGADVLIGGAGGDTLIGGAGADLFAFTAALGAGNVDAITDFSVADDTIALDDAVFAGLNLGALSAHAFVTGAAAQDGDDRIIYNSATGQLFFDADGSSSGAAVLFATLQPGVALTANDFTVI